MKTETESRGPFTKKLTVIRYSSVVAIKQRSAGNAEVGDMWLETKTFPKETPITEIMDWARDCSGKLIITWDEATEETITSDNED